MRDTKRRLDALGLYPRPISLRGLRIVQAGWVFRLPWIRRFDGYAAWRVIALRNPIESVTDGLIAHELCHIWQMQHRPLRMPLSYLRHGYRDNFYEREARWAATRSAYVDGGAVECPCCDGNFGGFIPHPPFGRIGICPRCESYARHRALWLWLRDVYGIASRRPRVLRVLHLAPEPILRDRLRSVEGVRYTGVDLDSALADVHADVEALPFADESFDLILCSHVLEHVADDRRALAECRRVLAHGALLALLVPIDPARKDTYEDQTITTPQARLEAFWQPDHVRLYGGDFADRVAAAGLSVETVRMEERLGHGAAATYGLGEHDPIFLARRA